MILWIKGMYADISLKFLYNKTTCNGMVLIIDDIFSTYFGPDITQNNSHAFCQLLQQTNKILSLFTD